MASSRGAPPPEPAREPVPVPTGADTRLYAVIGHPVAHSLSPRMQNAAFVAAGQQAAYVALDVPPPRLAEALAGLHAAGFAGLNVTLPHKEEALRLARAATPAARAAGAANTLRWTQGGWEAEATDGAGFVAWIRRLGLVPEGLRALVLGAGGAARAVAAALAARGAASILVVNRTRERADAVAAAAMRAAASNLRIEVAGMSAPETAGGRRDERFDVLVRALSVESVSEEERRWWQSVRPGGIVLDLNYGSRARAAREEAERSGRRYEDGLPLLVEQGALSYEFWIGQPAPREAMRAALT